MVTNVTIYNGRVMGYLDAAEFAKLNSISKNTVRVWIKRGKIPERYLLKIGNEWWIDTAITSYEVKDLRKKS